MTRNQPSRRQERQAIGENNKPDRNSACKLIHRSNNPIKIFALLSSNFLLFVKGFLWSKATWSAAACRRFESVSKLPHSISTAVSCDESEPRCRCRRAAGAPCRLRRNYVKPVLPHRSFAGTGSSVNAATLQKISALSVLSVDSRLQAASGEVFDS